jgi:hypothetical protein
MVEPFTTVPPLGSPRESDLWRWMADYEARTGGDVLAIPHNGNLSNGLMFALTQPFTDLPIDQDYVEARARWEPLYEVTQTKGDGETHPFLSPNDEFADFETWDKGNLDVSEAKEPDMLQHEYARSALRRGLQLEAEFGTNPFKFGMAGGTDATPASPPSRRTTSSARSPRWSPTRAADPRLHAERRHRPHGDGMGGRRRRLHRGLGPGEHPRGDLRRHEAPRDLRHHRLAHDRAPLRRLRLRGRRRDEPQPGDHRLHQGRADGRRPAPRRGGPRADLPRRRPARPDRRQPRPLPDRQGLDGRGRRDPREVYDVAWSDDREPGDDGRCPPVGSTVDVEDATWLNTIGAPELIAVWQDPDFDPEQKAFYYGRVLEIPTPRWTAYDAKYFGTEPEPGTEMELQERAYTSPIWYSPD